MAGGNGNSAAAGCHYPETETYAPPHRNAYCYGCANCCRYAAADFALANPIPVSDPEPAAANPNSNSNSYARAYSYANPHAISDAIAQGDDYRVRFL